MKTEAWKRAQKKYLVSRPDVMRRAGAKFRASEKGKRYHREYYLNKKYGIDSARYLELFAQQEGRCFICQRHQMELEKRLCVDHCHTTGVVRGLLCHPCNHAIGFLKDDVGLLERAILYLSKHKASGER